MYLYAFLGFMTGAESLGFEPGSSPKYAHGLTHLPIMPCYEYFSSILVLLRPTNILHCYTESLRSPQHRGIFRHESLYRSVRVHMRVDKIAADRRTSLNIHVRPTLIDTRPF